MAKGENCQDLSDRSCHDLTFNGMVFFIVERIRPVLHSIFRLREIDWLDFCTRAVVNSFATHDRLFRNAKERMRVDIFTDIQAVFSDLEAEYELGIC